MSKWINWATVALAAIAIIIAIWLGMKPWQGAQFQGGNALFQAAIQVASALFVVALFLERSLAVVNNLLFGEQLVDARTNVDVKAASGAAEAERAAAQWQLRAIEEKTQRLRLGVGFLAAVLIAAAGVRALSGLMTAPPSATDQGQLFQVMDILLTAGLLAGGSNGIAGIIDLLRKQVDSAKARQEAERRGAEVAPSARMQARMQRAGVAPEAAPALAAAAAP